MKYLKKISLLLLLFLFNDLNALSQNVGICTETPDNSAILDIQSTEKGLLIPRLTTIQRNNIVAPINGLIIFDTDEKKICYHNSIEWICIDTNTDGTGSTGPQGEQGNTGPQGEQGENGTNCWDLNENGANEINEDSNNDGQWTVLDCTGDTSNDLVD